MADNDLDDIFADGDMGDGDGTSEIIRQALKEQGFDDDFADDAGFDQPPLDDTYEDNTVSQEDGARMASDAKIKGQKDDTDNKAAKDAVEEGGDKEGSAAKAKGKPEADAESDGDDDAGADKEENAETSEVSSIPLDDLLKDVPEASRAEVSRRLTEAESALAPFRTGYAKDAMSRFGASPNEFATRLVELADFATEKPAEYLAWVSREMAATPDKAAEVLGKAAELHGYKLVSAEGDEDDDLFITDEMKELRAENARLKAAQEPSFGPDTPELRAQRTMQQEIDGFINATDKAGKPLRPHFHQLEPQIVSMSQRHAQTTGEKVTVADLDRFYKAAEANMRSLFGNSAAQGKTNVADQAQKNAAAAEKARRASTSIDGSGQGAPRRPALAHDAPIEDVIAAAYKSSMGG